MNVKDILQSTEVQHTNITGSIKLLPEIHSENNELRVQNSSLKEALSSQQQKYSAHCSELQQQLIALQEELQAASKRRDSEQVRHEEELERMKTEHKATLEQVRGELNKQFLLQQEMVAKHRADFDELRMESDRHHRIEQEQVQMELDKIKNELSIEETINEHMRVELEQLNKAHSMCTSFSACLIKHSDVRLYQDKHLGGGAWGYVVEGLFRGQKVAVKCVHSLVLSEGTHKRVRREVATMAQVRHPNLVLFIGAVLDDQGGGGPLIITELLDTTLRNAYEKGLLERGKAKFMNILVEVASALSYLHQHETPIIHRDVSSANVLLEAMAKGRWKAKLSDFGSANWVHQAVTLGEGSIVYTAPEAYPVPPGEAIKPQTTKIDVYSYGILTCEVALRKFPSCEDLEEMKQNMKVAFPELYPLVMNCIEKYPTRRLAMAEVLNVLESCIGE